jgi:hypothetical protein
MKTMMKATMIASTALAFTAAVIYVLVGTDVVSIPTLGADQAPVAIWFFAAGGYFAGGVLILWRRRWLWTVGLVANSLVMSIFFLAYRQQPEMLLSMAGLATKTAQAILEAGLIYLVAAWPSTSQPAHRTQSRPMELTQLR